MKGYLSPGDICFFVTVALLMLSGCDSQSPESGADLVCTDGLQANVLRPLTVGNFWVYEKTNLRGEVEDSLKREVVGSVSDPSIPGGVGYVIKRSRLSNPRIFDERIWVNTDGGHSMVGIISDGDTAFADFLKYPFPTTAGTEFYSYTWTDPAGPDDELFISDSTQYEVISTSESFSSPAGTFSTHTYRNYYQENFDAFGRHHFRHFAPGVGLVGETQYDFLNADRNSEPDYTESLVEICVLGPED